MSLCASHSYSDSIKIRILVSFKWIDSHRFRLRRERCLPKNANRIICCCKIGCRESARQWKNSGKNMCGQSHGSFVVQKYERSSVACVCVCIADARESEMHTWCALIKSTPCTLMHRHITTPDSLLVSSLGSGDTTKSIQIWNVDKIWRFKYEYERARCVWITLPIAMHQFRILLFATERTTTPKSNKLWWMLV